MIGMNPNPSIEEVDAGVKSMILCVSMDLINTFTLC